MNSGFSNPSGQKNLAEHTVTAVFEKILPLSHGAHGARKGIGFSAQTR